MFMFSFAAGLIRTLYRWIEFAFMHPPEHAVQKVLPIDYFACGKSPWVMAFYNSKYFYFERQGSLWVKINEGLTFPNSTIPIGDI